MNRFIFAICFVNAVPVFAATPWELELTAEAIDKHLVQTTGEVQATKLKDTAILSISNGGARVRDIPVSARTKYTLAVDASFAGEVESIEENPRFEIFNQLGRTSPRLPSRTIQFVDQDGKVLRGELRYAMPFRNRHTYVDQFYTPPKTAAVRISLSSGNPVILQVAQVSLKEAPAKDTLNINPSFALGRHNYAGWQNIRGGGKLFDRNGQTVLDTKYGSTTLPIPIVQPGTYAFSAKATGNGFNSVVILRVFDSSGKELMRSSTRRYGPAKRFVTPPDAAYVSFLVYSCLLEELHLTRVGDEQAIRSLK